MRSPTTNLGGMALSRVGFQPNGPRLRLEPKRPDYCSGRVQVGPTALAVAAMCVAP